MPAWAIVARKVNGRPIVYSLHLDEESAIDALQELVEAGVEARIIPIFITFI